MVMRIIIIGPTLLTRKCLEALTKNGKDEIISVYTLDNLQGSRKSRFAIMDDIAMNNKISLHKVADINNESVIEQIRNSNPDVIFELGWSQIISSEILGIPKKGCIGVHASLLPKNRGAASLNWALIRGDKKTGVTLFYLAEKPDDGEIIDQKEFDIDERDDIATLHSKSDLASVELLLENIDKIRSDKVNKIKQDISKATYTTRRSPGDGVINWSKTSEQIYNWIRAQTHPFPGTFTFWKNKKLFIWSANVSNHKSIGKPGEIFNIKKKDGILVNTSDNMILIKRAQLEDGLEMWSDDLAQKISMKDGDIFG